MINTKQIGTNAKKMFSPLKFEAKRHLYYIMHSNGYMEYLPSVSSKVESYVPPFDMNKWLPLCARKEGMSEAELAHKWQTINKLACDLGTETHKWLEKWDGFRTPNTPQKEAGVLFLKSIQNRYTIIGKELRMYHRKYKYAGTCDLLLYDRYSDSLVLADYKTNGDLFKTFDMMNAPFGYLQSHPYNHYQIQLSLYNILLEQLGYPVSNRLIVHLDSLGQYRTYDAYYFRNELVGELDRKLKTKLAA